MSVQHVIKVAADAAGNVLVQAKGDPARIVAVGAAAAIVFVGVGVGYGIYTYVNNGSGAVSNPPPPDTSPQSPSITVVGVQSIPEQGGKMKFQVESFEGVLQAFNGRLAVLTNNSAVHCKSAILGPQERFRFIDVGSGEFAMQGANGKFVLADPNNGGVLEARGESVKDWERFHLVEHGNGTLSIRSNVTGKFVCADQNCEQRLIADREDKSEWERFRIGIV